MKPVLKLLFFFMFIGVASLRAQVPDYEKNYEAGVKCASQNKRLLAIGFFTSAIAEKHDFWLAYRKRGEVYQSIRDTAHCLADFLVYADSAGVKDGLLERHVNEAAWYLFKQNKWQESFDVFQSGLKIGDTSSSIYIGALINMGKCAENIGLFLKADSIYSDAVKHKDQFSKGNAYYYRGLLRLNKFHQHERGCADILSAGKLQCYELYHNGCPECADKLEKYHDSAYKSKNPSHFLHDAGYEFAPKFGICFQPKLGIEAGISLVNNSEYYHAYGPAINADFIILPTKGFASGPKLCYEFSNLLFGGRVGFADYFSPSYKPDYRVILEGGIALFGGLDFYLGAYIPVTDFNQKNELGIFRFSIIINLIDMKMESFSL